VSTPFIDCHNNIDIFLDSATSLHLWIRARLDLCGGWSAQLDKMYTPRCFGYYAFSPAQSCELRRIALRLWQIYSKIGSQIENLIAAETLPSDWPLDHFQQTERDILNEWGRPSCWATTLRADVVFDDNDRAQVVEVNTDNVGGLEDLLMMIGFHARHEDDPDRRKLLFRSLERLTATYDEWLTSHYRHFQSKIDKRPSDLRDAGIAIVAEDRESSSALTRVLAAHLRARGFNATACRPEHLTIGPGGESSLIDELGSGTKPVHVILRDLLWEELFDDENERRVPKPHLHSLLDQGREGQVLFLNPLTERLLFSKAVLAELCTKKHGLFETNDLEDEFLSRYVAPTEFYDASSHVLKPASAYGGQGVMIVEGRRPSNGRARTMPWVRQARLNAETVNTLYRPRSELTPTRRDLFAVHGLIIYGAPGGDAKFAGVMTRVGPDPVVNFSKGAQIVPGVLSDENW
jgi:glutathionylspermidine synthase